MKRYEEDPTLPGAHPRRAGDVDIPPIPPNLKTAFLADLNSALDDERRIRTVKTIWTASLTEEMGFAFGSRHSEAIRRELDRIGESKTHAGNEPF